MPWKPSDASSHCKQCNPSKWASIANAVLAKCKKDGGSDCEGKAVRIANAKSKSTKSNEDILREVFEEWGIEVTDEEIQELLSEDAAAESVMLGNHMVFKGDFNKTVVFNDVSELQEDDDEKNTGEIQMLRSGRFEHPWYGVLAFDEKFFGNLIQNYKDGVPYQEFALDFGHNPDGGAAGWFKDLKVKKKGKKCELWGEVEFTPKGRSALKNKEFKFFSIEFASQYKDAETGKMYGPTFFGGALTNRPFIKRMKPVAMSDEFGLELEFDFIGDEEETKKSDKKEKQKIENKEEDLNMDKFQEILAEIARLNEEFAKLSEKVKADPNDKESLEALSEVQKNLSDVTTKLEEAQKQQSEDNKNLSEVRAELEEAKKKNTELSEAFKNMMKEREIEKRQAYRDGIKSKVVEFSRDLGVPPALCRVAEQVLLAEGASKISLKLSETGDDGTVTERELSLTGVFERIFKNLPEEAKVDFTEKGETKKDDKDKKLFSLEDAEAYSKEKEITFEDALIELSAQGKLDEG